jgi:glycosyltransferase involved in cell wall biosynthesis
VRVALVTTAQPGRGNYTTVQRWLRHVKRVEIVVVPADTGELDFVPDVVDGYHALHAGPTAMRLASRTGTPLVINLGGTDLHACLKGDAAVERVLLAAARVTGAFQAFGEQLRAHFGRPLPYVTVPRGVEVPRDLPPREPHGEMRALLPAGLRPVKDVLFAIELADRLRAAGLPLALRILGPVMDPHYARRVRARAAESPAVVVEEALPAAMREAYLAADVVWNTSLHEGGSNALLEAVACGCAVFARDIPGNRELLEEEGAQGMLFDPADTDAAAAFHRRLLAETATERQNRVKKGLDWLRRLHDPTTESTVLEGIYYDLGGA